MKKDMFTIETAKALYDSVPTEEEMMNIKRFLKERRGHRFGQGWRKLFPGGKSTMKDQKNTHYKLYLK